ncbi:hypothetical protein HELRODRAFT_169662 [Helobdella robusta]|uniref:diphthine methyl ester synthase n=1 Tax=Helobdella robusta TaxID=6412 RepID=T1F274_HELRO|nr:hypothetical protein HELRODRAFT_169662 [Helobdella robusta]ESO07949.1 hypothetical protein HELRODRAFT_169662 [Helobdella robusta]
MLFLIGLGLGNADDITVKGLKLLQQSSKIYLENYTSILSIGKNELEKVYGRELILADREMVEQNADVILDEAEREDVSFLVVGDPFGATTHSDLLLRAKERNIKTQIVHNASICNAVGCCGLQLYKFGETVSIVFWEIDWQPESFYDKILANKERGLHTLCLLDIKIKEKSVENIIKNRNIYEPERFMTVNVAIEQILEISKRRNCQVITPQTKGVGLARIGADNQLIKYGSLEELKIFNFGPKLHSLVIIGDLHPLEHDLLCNFSS